MSYDDPSAEPTPAQRYAQSLAKLTAKQRAFVLAYVDCLNASEAARRAKYSERSARVVGAENLTKPDIADAIRLGLGLQAMPAEEIIARLNRIARGSLADVISMPDPESDGDQRDAWNLDMVKAQRTGGVALIKKLRQGKEGPEIELYSAHEALRDLAKIRGMFVDRHEHTGAAGGPIEIIEIVAEDGDSCGA